MRKLLLAAGVAVLALAACGGGGSSGGGGPVVVPTVAPPAAPTVAIKYSGTGAQLQSMLARPMSSSVGPTNQLVVLSAEPLDGTQWSGSWISGASWTGQSSGEVSVVVSPAPTAMPSPTAWAVAGAPVSFAQTSSVQTVVAPTPLVYAQGINQSGTGTVTATVPNIGTASTSVYVYPHLSIACTGVNPSVYGTSSVEAEGGVQMVNGVATPTMTLASADLYVDGPNCYGQFANTAEAGVTYHCPYGCVFIADSTQFVGATSAMFSNPTLTMTASVMDTNMGSGMFLFKDSAGHIYKAATHAQNSWNVPQDGTYCALPCAIDGTT